jgi:hypothetical protein
VTRGDGDGRAGCEDNGSGEGGRQNGTDVRPRSKSVGFRESNIREG